MSDIEARTGLHLRAIGIAAGAIAAAVLLSVIAALLLVRHFGLPLRADRQHVPYVLMIPGATLESAPQPELQRYRAAKQQEAQAGGWVNGPQGTVQVPIATAMQMLARPAGAASAPQAKR